MPPPERWDIFCRVVDNFGDAGVAWRFSRQLVREHGKRVRLFLDDLRVLAKLRPPMDALSGCSTKTSGAPLKLRR